MSSLLCTEIGSSALIAITIWLFILYIKSPNQWILILVSGVTLGEAILFRPVLSILLPLFIIILFLFLKSHWKCIGLTLGYFLTGILISHLILVSSFSIAAHHFTLLPLENPSSAYALLSGTNITSQGYFQDQEAIQYFSWPTKIRLRNTVDEAIQRIISNPSGFINLIEVKMVHLLADNTYGLNWALTPLDTSLLNTQQVNKIRTIGLPVSQASYIITMGLSLYYLIRSLTRNPFLTYVVISFILLLVLPHVLLEAQPRYHHILLIPLAILSGMQISSIHLYKVKLK
jgi:4-amino-4-deoxy-L-arabinose transferase-like glycosyltransferase